jgi:class 3 adenylate cyclase
MSPEELVKELDDFFAYFDKVVERHGLEKIKTIGDAYMCAGGIPNPNITHPVDMVLAGLDIQRYMEKMKSIKIAEGKPYWELRLGIHTGSLVTGVVGKKKFAYDIWGDTVNTASRTESSGVTGMVNISETTYNLVADFFVCEYRGKIAAKNKGELDMYLIKHIKPELSLDGKGESPNQVFRENLKLALYHKLEAFNKAPH